MNKGEDDGRRVSLVGNLVAMLSLPFHLYTPPRNSCSMEEPHIMEKIKKKRNRYRWGHTQPFHNRTKNVFQIILLVPERGNGAQPSKGDGMWFEISFFFSCLGQCYSKDTFVFHSQKTMALILQKTMQYLIFASEISFYYIVLYK